MTNPNSMGEIRARLERLAAKGQMSEGQWTLATQITDAIARELKGETPSWDAVAVDPDDGRTLIELFLPRGRIGLYVGEDASDSRLFWLDATRKDDLGLPLTGFAPIDDRDLEATAQAVIALTSRMALQSR